MPPYLDTICVNCKCYVALYVDGDNANCPLCHTAVYKLISGEWVRMVQPD